MIYEPRQYQRDAVDDVKHRLLDNPCLVAPTGSGKSVMGAMLVEELSVPTLWLAHRKELIEQAADHLRRLGLYVGIIKAGFPVTPMASVQVASVMTLIRREKPPTRLIVIDEAHHAAAGSYQSIIDAYPGVPVVGLTATPFRLDGKGLGDLFGALVVAATPAELCDSGILHRPRVYATVGPDLAGVKITAGDYNLGQLAKRTNIAEANTDVVREWQTHANNARTVAFAVNIEHSKAITAAFRAAGVPAEHLDGNTAKDARGAILWRLRAGVTRVVVNCMVLTEGFDLPALECAIICRPTASLNLHLQMIGRIMRSCHGKNGALVLDHGGNHHRHGLVTRRLEYSLEPGKKVGTSEPLGLRRCRECGLFFETTMFACPECGWMPSAEEVGGARVLPALHGDGSLSEFDDADFVYRQAAWDRFEDTRSALGFQPGWSKHQYKERFGEWPTLVDGRLVDTENASMDEKQAFYADLVAVGNEKGFQPGWASHTYRDAFGVWPKGFVNDVRQRAAVERFNRKAAAT